MGKLEINFDGFLCILIDRLSAHVSLSIEELSLTETHTCLLSLMTVSKHFHNWALPSFNVTATIETKHQLCVAQWKLSQKHCTKGLKMIGRLEKVARTIPGAHILLLARGRKPLLPRKWKIQSAVMRTYGKNRQWKQALNSAAEDVALIWRQCTEQKG